MSLKDQLVGTWIYVSSEARRDDGTKVPRPSAQGAVTYTADGRFHFITTRIDAPKYASSDPARPSPDEAMAIASGSIAYTGTYTVDEARDGLSTLFRIRTADGFCDRRAPLSWSST